MIKGRISIKDVSALAGVSTATVSNVFSGRKPVNEALATRVREAAATLGYQPDRAAAQLRSGRTNVVAVLVPDLTDTFFATIVTRLEALANTQGYDVIVASSGDQRSVEASRLEALLAWRPAGVIAMPCSNIVPEALVAEAGRMPVVLVDRVMVPSALADTVTIDNRDAGAIAARHLVEHGHRDIVLAASHMDIAPVEQRMQAAADHILQETGRRATILELGSSVEEGSAVVARWLERHAVPDAVIASTNVTTLAVLSAFARFRIAIPERTSIVAFDDSAWMSARNTGLTAIRQPAEAMAEAAWERLCIRMQGRGAMPPTSIVLQAGLVVRSSVGKRAPERAGASPPGETSAETRHPPDPPPPGVERVH
ncbi:LacI family DNA-binding transcriptional regulator [Aureimonas sp. AU12]|uniref:LacI family DNA-binding transcriptional regulator n=1 Tax=Aureimonas sp. AU12 TaxID=1638161 RepID=UPI0007815B51|nr:LacI family DNA-binding transcriptional regulator [Aureimonas sp. AU12]